MWYEVEVTCPANSQGIIDVETRIAVTHGVITHVSYRPRPGHNGLCHTRMFYHDLQIWPVDRGQDLHGDTFPIERGGYCEIFSEPYEVVLRSYNEDDTYQHTFDLGFALLPEQVAAPVNWGQVMKDIFSLLSPRRILGG